ncbi:stage II sporulation protein B [Paenibacillus sp. 1_12]|uniref:SPOR domain-containing protein n=1 Tax=Paenibacillus sp. 1_12 TaxID=1566278 RepID=UPI0008E730C8|nr:SPOR domain-containing protein [Paenibacillus sp. 1_12]SFK70032.1 stage II sporulation protein B [Paenibacillus sp. 1_12]
MSKAKMTFRFDQGYRNNVGNPERKPKEQQVIPLRPEEYKVTPVDTQTLNPYPNDFGGWESSFDTETQRVEKLIRESGHGTRHEPRHEPRHESRPGSIKVSGQEPIVDLNYELNRDTGAPNHRLLEQDDPFFAQDTRQDDHMDPIRDHRWYVPEETFLRRRKKAASWFKVAASVAGAVATGAAFGFLVLSMFSQDSQDSKTNATVPAAANVTANAAVPAKTAPTDQAVPVSGAIAPASSAGKAADKIGSVAVSASANGGAMAAVNVPAKTLTFLQSGVFSTSQGAAAAQSEMKKKGLAAVSDVGDKYPVYVGMASNRDEAARLAQQFKQQKIDVIVKSVDMPALTKIKWTGKSTDIVSAFILQGDNLIQQITPLTVSHLTEAKLTGMDASQVQSLKTAHQTWAGMTAGVNEGLSEEGKAAVLKINSAMNSAVTSLDEYRKSPSAAMLWQTQNAILQAALAQKEFRQVILAT